MEARETLHGVNHFQWNVGTDDEERTSYRREGGMSITVMSAHHVIVLCRVGHVLQPLPA